MRKLKKIEMSWGEGWSSLLGYFDNDGKIRIMDYEYEHSEIHMCCGGRLTYESQSGATGKGHIERYEDFFPIGMYRVDTKINNWHGWEEIFPGVSLMLPYAPHGGEGGSWFSEWEPMKMADILRKYPVIIKADKGRTLVYCNFYTNVEEVLKKLLTGKDLGREPQVLEKRFYNSCGYATIKEVKFYNFFGRSYYPWEFMEKELEDYAVEESTERVHKIFHILEGYGGFRGTSRIAGKTYPTSYYETDPCEQMTKAPRGWMALATNMMSRLCNNDKEVYVVGWKCYKSEFEKVAKRVAKLFSEADQQALKAYFDEHMSKQKYVEYELTVNKVLFFLDKEAQIAEVHKNIGRKVRQDVMNLARQFCSNFNDKELVEAIPDDFIIKFEDSLKSGNCQPGTQKFVDAYFPGMTQCKAGALKEFADNWNVMRILKYIAIREGFVANAKQMTMPAE